MRWVGSTWLCKSFVPALAHVFCLFIFHGFTAFDFSHTHFLFVFGNIYQKEWMSERDPVPSVRARQGVLAAQVLSKMLRSPCVAGAPVRISSTEAPRSQRHGPRLGSPTPSACWPLAPRHPVKDVPQQSSGPGHLWDPQPERTHPQPHEDGDRPAGRHSQRAQGCGQGTPGGEVQNQLTHIRLLGVGGRWGVRFSKEEGEEEVEAGRGCGCQVGVLLK